MSFEILDVLGNWVKIPEKFNKENYDEVNILNYDSSKYDYLLCTDYCDMSHYIIRNKKG